MISTFGLLTDAPASEKPEGKAMSMLVPAGMVVHGVKYTTAVVVSPGLVEPRSTVASRIEPPVQLFLFLLLFATVGEKVGVAVAPATDAPNPSVCV